MNIFVRFRMASISKITIAFPSLSANGHLQRGKTFEAEVLAKLPLLPTFGTETMRSQMQALPT
jgi:hypothetical protein